MRGPGLVDRTCLLSELERQGCIAGEVEHGKRRLEVRIGRCRIADPVEQRQGGLRRRQCPDVIRGGH